MSLLLGLQYSNQYPQAVQLELTQLIAAIQTWANQNVGWTDVPFNPANVSANSGGSLTTQNTPYVFRYAIVNRTMIVQLALGVTITNGATTAIQLVMPRTTVPPLSATVAQLTQPADVGIWSSGASGGVLAVEIVAGSNRLSLSRYDGTPYAPFPTAVCIVRGTVAIPLGT